MRLAHDKHQQANFPKTNKAISCQRLANEFYNISEILHIFETRFPILFNLSQFAPHSFVSVVNDS